MLTIYIAGSVKLDTATQYTMWMRLGILFMALTLSNFSSAADFLCDPFTESYKTCNCDKTTFTVTCRGGLGGNTSVFQKLPAGVQAVIVTGNDFTELPENLFGNCTHPNKRRPELRKLDLSNNAIRLIHGKTFHCISNVEELILRDNDWQLDNHNRVFSSLDKLKVLDLDNAFSDMVNCTDDDPPSYCTKSLTKLTVYINTTGMAALEHLNLARNEIWTIPEETQVQFGSLSSLLKLNLSDNDIAFPRLSDRIKTLQELDLSNNRIPYLRSDFIKDLNKQSSLHRLYIQDNLYECDCWMKNFTLWLQNNTSSKIVNKPGGLECFVGFGKIQEGDTIMSLKVDDLVCPSDDNYIYRYSPTVVAMSILCVVVAVVLLAILFLNRGKIKATWRKCLYSQSGLHSTPPAGNQHRYSSVKT